MPNRCWVLSPSGNRDNPPQFPSYFALGYILYCDIYSSSWDHYRQDTFSQNEAGLSSVKDRGKELHLRPSLPSPQIDREAKPTNVAATFIYAIHIFYPKDLQAWTFCLYGLQKALIKMDGT